AARQGGLDGGYFSVALGVYLAGKTVAGFATDARAALMALHRERERERFDPLMLEGRCHLLNHRFVIEGGIGIFRNARRLRGIDSGLPVNSIHLLRKIVVRCKLTIADRPRE